MEPGPNQLPTRNVEVFDSEGNVIAGFWQYGTLQWDEFYRYLTAFVVTSVDWSIFQYDLTQQQTGALCPPETDIVSPGDYILLSTAGEPIRVGLGPTPARARHPTTHYNTPSRQPYYHTRCRTRDSKCLITGLLSQTYSRLKVAHIFSRAHDAEWIRKGYPSKITDTVDVALMGGQIKIDSVQNLITLRSDLHGAWDNYEFGVDPNNNYRITSFTNGNADINGSHLQLDHIQNKNLRPLDELFMDHFMQGLFKHMKGAGEQGRRYEYDENAFEVGDDFLDLSNAMIWGTRGGKERFEVALADRLFDHRLLQQDIQEMVP